MHDCNSWIFVVHVATMHCTITIFKSSLGTLAIFYLPGPHPGMFVVYLAFCSIKLGTTTDSRAPYAVISTTPILWYAWTYT